MSGSHIGAGGKGRKETRLEQSFCTMRLPLDEKNSDERQVGAAKEKRWGRKRRVDLIFACQSLFSIAAHQGCHSRSSSLIFFFFLSAYDVYYCAILGWSGSTMFERDLRFVIVYFPACFSLALDSSTYLSLINKSTSLCDSLSGDMPTPSTLH